MTAEKNLSTRLGIGSYTYPWAVGIPNHLPGSPLTAARLLEKAVELQVGVVQICDNLTLDALAENEFADLEQTAQQLQLDIEVGTRGIAPAHLRKYIRIAARFRSPILRVVVDSGDHQPDPPEVIRIIDTVLGELEQAGICLAIENHDRFTANQLKEIITQLDCPLVGICLDTANSFGALEGPGVVVPTLAPFVANLHVKEFRIRRMEHQLGFIIEGCSAGKGMLDLPWLLRQLESSAHRFNAILEQWIPFSHSIEDTIRREQQCARESVDYLRTLIQQ